MATNYLFDLPNDLIDLIYQKKHQSELADVVRDISGQTYRATPRSNTGVWTEITFCRFLQSFIPKDELAIGTIYEIRRNGNIDGMYKLTKRTKNHLFMLDETTGQTRKVGTGAKTITFRNKISCEIDHYRFKQRIAEMARPDYWAGVFVD